MTRYFDIPGQAQVATCVVLGGPDTAQLLLLVRRGREPYRDCWALPSGFLEVDESFEQAARRELAEETGIRWDAAFASTFRFVSEQGDPRGAIECGVFCVHAGVRVPDVCGADDVTEAHWFRLDALPLPLAFDHEGVLEAMLAHPLGGPEDDGRRSAKGGVLHEVG